MSESRQLRTHVPNLIGLLLALSILAALPALLNAQEGEQLNHAGWPAVYPPPDAPPPEPPFILPFTAPPGPSTWFVGQAFGNTEGALVLREIFYLQGQGLHFGLDLAAPCGTEVVAIGDGLVSEVDRHGAEPHSLMIDHPNGYSSLYGHLMEKPALEPGQPVKQGQVIGLSGDAFGTCRTAPHLHLEIRSNFHDRAYNPLPLLQADWDSLTLIGAYRPGYERDLENPRHWQDPRDQPTVFFGGPLLNDYPHPWPPPGGDWPER